MKTWHEQRHVKPWNKLKMCWVRHVIHEVRHESWEVSLYNFPAKNIKHRFLFLTCTSPQTIYVSRLSKFCRDCKLFLDLVPGTVFVPDRERSDCSRTRANVRAATCGQRRALQFRAVHAGPCFLTMVFAWVFLDYSSTLIAAPDRQNSSYEVLWSETIGESIGEVIDEAIDEARE